MDAGKPEIRQALHAMLRETGAGDEPHGRGNPEHFLATAHWKNAGTVMLFAPLRYEPDTMPLMELERERGWRFPLWITTSSSPAKCDHRAIWK